MVMEKSALLSSCGKYRYWLKRRWGRGQVVCWVMLNPSTADAEIDDPTIRRCVGFSQGWGYGGMYVVNLFAYRATDPAELKRMTNAVGIGNDGWIVRLAVRSHRVVCAWGNHGGLRGSTVRSLLDGLHPMCLGRTKSGSPKHPLYVKSSVALESY